ncbi:MAG: transglutaminaseTgpA domain-containing protein, partial [Acidimicrobiales bacterium]
MTIVGPPFSKTPLPSLRAEPHIGEVDGNSADRKKHRRGGQHSATPVEQPDLLPHRSAGADVLGEIALFVAALAAALGVARLIQGGFGAPVLGPIYLTILAGSAVSTLVARKRAPLVVVAALGGLAAALTAVWTIAPGATRFGVPTITTFHAIRHQIDIARAVMSSHRTPVPAAHGIVFIAAIAAGAVCVVGRIIWEASLRSKRQWPRSLALIPTFGMFCYSAPLSAEIDRPQTAICYLVAGMFFVVASDAGRTALVRTGTHKRGRALAATVTAPITTAITALLVFLVAAAALAGTVPVPFPWWTNNPLGTGGYAGRGGAGGTVTAESLVANMKADEVRSANVQMFQAVTAVPTYWQVGILTDFNGTEWVPNRAEAQTFAGGQQSPAPEPVLPSYTADPTFFTTIKLQGYTGRLVPASPTSIAQTTNSPGTSLRVSSSLGVVAPSQVTDGFSYQLVAAETSAPSLSSGPTTLSQIYSGLGASKSEYLHLPSGIPADVDTIAHQIVVGAKTPMEEV